MIIHIWDNETEERDFRNDDKSWQRVDYLTFCGTWVGDGRVAHPRDNSDLVNCESCILLRFEREAKNGTRKNTEISGVA